MSGLSFCAEYCTFGGLIAQPFQMRLHVLHGVSLAFGLLIEPMGRWVIAVSASLSLAALIAPMLLHQSRPGEKL
jgi:hypothetical protein